jgi:DNA/RNA endonuclease YhcR with UshA esterase domain
MIFLNSEGDRSSKANFVVVIGKAATHKFEKASIPDVKSHFNGKTIRVTGKVTLYNRQPQILIEEPNQILLADPAEPISPSEAGRYVNTPRTVEMDVKSAGENKTGVLFFLNSEERFQTSTNLTVVIPKKVAEKLQVTTVEDLKNRFQGKTIRVKGVISLYQNRPQLEVTEPEQIHVVR